MNEDTLNMEVKAYLKKMGLTSQREIEKAVRKAIEDKAINCSESLDISITLTMPGIGLTHCLIGEIALE
jgi:hypothetical protein